MIVRLEPTRRSRPHRTSSRSEAGPNVIVSITPKDLHARIVSNNELALIDLREGGVFADRHLLFANNIPLSRLELRIGALVPRRDVPVVLCGKGNDDDLIALGAERLARFGYSDIARLNGGVDAWERAGFELFSGVNVPSKAFGEFVEHTSGTPHIVASDLHAMMERGENMIVMDSRPMVEYHAMSIPGGIDVPGAELAYRFDDMVTDPETTVIVNCAGRTRSIIGAQSLINAGVPNRVIALENGTMGWHLAGYQLDRGKTARYPEISDAGRAAAQKRRENVAARYGVKTMAFSAVQAWQNDLTRTTYLLDVRDPDEYAEGHMPGTISAPGGQLVQATDQYVGIRGARLVLVDDDEVRATMCASWLIQMGWPDVVVLDGGVDSVDNLEIGKYSPKVMGLDQAAPAALTPDELSNLVDAGNVCVIDLATSLQYRDDGHVPGAWYAIRSRLGDNLKTISHGGKIVLTSPNGDLARLAAGDAGFSGLGVQVLKGGTEAWKQAGLPVETGFTNMADKTDDIWYRPYDLNEGGDEGAMKQYLSWEVDLVGQIERDGTTSFRTFPENQS